MRWLQASSFRETLRFVRRLLVVGIVMGFAACAQPAPTAAPPPATSVFSPDMALRVSVGDGADGNSSLAQAPTPGVLQEILAATPKNAAASTAPNGATLIGTETDVKEDGPSENALSTKGSGNKAKKSPVVEGGAVEVQALPAHAAERLSRAQVYHRLVMRCRDTDGRILPPDAIVLRFRIDEEGNIVPSSISAVAADKRHEAAANCMRRELSAVAFRGPAAFRGTSTSLRATIPSVD